MRLIFQWLIATIAIVIAAYLIPNVTIDSFVTGLILAIVLGALNLLVKPILLILTLPVNVITLGLFTIVINAALVWLADYLVAGFQVQNFGWAILYALALSIINIVFKKMDGQYERGHNY